MVDPLVLFCLFIFMVMILLEVPMPFAMVASTLIYSLWNGQSLIMYAQRTASSFSDYTLLAIPAFLFVGCFMNEIGLTALIFKFCGDMIGHIPGGLGHANILASMVFAGMSGSALADAGGLGNIEVKAMRDAGYDEEFSVAVTAASSAIGPIIPPSINFVVYGFMTQTSSVALFIGGLIPGVIMGITMMIWVYIAVKYFHVKAPMTPKASAKERLQSLWKALPALSAPILLIIGILTGVFTTTECGVVAGIYCLALGFYYRKVNVKLLVEALKQTLTTTCMTTFLIATGAVFNWMLITGGVVDFLTTLLLSMDSVAMTLLVLNVILLILGCFMGSMSILIMMAPLLVSLATGLNLNLVHLGVLSVLNMTLSLITPPMAPSLFTTCRIANVKFEGALKHALPFMIPLVGTLLLITYVPECVLWLPRVFGFL